MPIELRRRYVNALGLCALGGNDVPGRAPAWHGAGLDAQPGHARRRRRQGLLLSPRKSFAGRSFHQPDVRRDRAVSLSGVPTYPTRSIPFFQRCGRVIRRRATTPIDD